MTYYCHLHSPGVHTNLQLYSLEQAARDWNELIEMVAEYRIEDIDHFKERLTFILSSLGLSLSQLLGQNCPSPESEKMDPPRKLLSAILRRASINEANRKRLNFEFSDFLSYYDAVRHFGKTKNERHYHAVDQLTIEKLNLFRQMTIEIWDVVISIYRKDNPDNFDEFPSISDAVGFSDYVKRLPLQRNTG